MGENVTKHIQALSLNFGIFKKVYKLICMHAVYVCVCVIYMHVDCVCIRGVYKIFEFDKKNLARDCNKVRKQVASQLKPVTTNTYA